MQRIKKDTPRSGASYRVSQERLIRRYYSAFTALDVNLESLGGGSVKVRHTWHPWQGISHLPLLTAKRRLLFLAAKRPDFRNSRLIVNCYWGSGFGTSLLLCKA